MLKIAVVSKHFPSSVEPSQGRSAYQTMRVMATMADVRVFYPHATYPSFLEPKTRVIGDHDASYSPEGVRVDYFDYKALPVVTRPLNGWLAARTVLPHVRAFNPDIILSYIVYPDGYAGVLVAKALAVPAIVVGVGSDVHSTGDSVSRMLTRRVLGKADFLLTVSGDLRQRAIEMGALPEKSRVLINGCDLLAFKVGDRVAAREKLGIDKDAEAVVYIGRMDIKKGLRELVEAAAAIHSERPKMHVYVVGDGPDKAIIESAVVSHNAAGFVHLMPGCVFNDVAVWMAASDLVTLPSYMEGCPNVVLEALASGRPVVATNVGGIPEIMDEDCGCLVPPRDSEALANGLSLVLDRTWDAEVLSQKRGRSWIHAAEELHGIMESVIAAYKAKHDVG